MSRPAAKLRDAVRVVLAARPPADDEIVRGHAAVRDTLLSAGCDPQVADRVAVDLVHAIADLAGQLAGVQPAALRVRQAMESFEKELSEQARKSERKATR